MIFFRTIGWLAFSLASGLSGAHAQSLVQFFEQASAHDSAFASAKAQHQADTFYREIGAAGLRPSISVSGSLSAAEYQRQDLGATTTRSYDYRPESWSVQITQPIYSAERLANAAEGELRALRAAVVLKAAQQDLALRVAHAWLNFLLDLDQTTLAQAQLQSYLAQKDQAQRLRDAGIATRTDVEETASRAQIASADLAASQASLSVRRREFERVVGAPPPNALHPDALRFNLAALSSNMDVDEWVAVARVRSVVVMAQQLALEIAKTQHKKARAGFMPSLSVIASHQSSRSGNYFTASEATGQIALQLNMSLYDGGGTTAQARQAVALIAKAGSDVTAAQEDSAIKAADAALNVQASFERVAALENAIGAATVTLQGMEAGQKAGLRTNSDDLNAKQQLYAVRRDLARERYTLMSRNLELRLLAGQDITDAVAMTERAVYRP